MVFWVTTVSSPENWRIVALPSFNQVYVSIAGCARRPHPRLLQPPPGVNDSCHRGEETSVGVYSVESADKSHVTIRQRVIRSGF